MSESAAAACPFCERVDNGDYVPLPDSIFVVRFEPLRPVTAGHMLFVPVQHFVDAADSPFHAGRTFQAAAEYARHQEDAFNLITSAGPAATQTVMHLHVHYVPRREGDGLALPWTGQEAKQNVR